MRQKLPKAPTALTIFGLKTALGLNRFGDDVGVKHIKEAILRDSIEALAHAQDQAEAAQTARKATNAEIRAVDKQVKTFIRITRELLKPALGDTYAIEWKEVGFVRNSLGIPRIQASRFSQMSSIQLFLQRFPEHVKPGVLTPEMAAALYERAVNALSARNVATAIMREKTILRDAAKAVVQRQLRALFQELKYLLPANDPRWLEFGFNIPGDVSVPAAPENVVVTTVAPGAVSVTWEVPVNTEHSRVFCKVVGQDDEFVAKASTNKTKEILTGLPSGAQLQFYVTAVNRSGESVPSKIVVVDMPLPASTA